MSCSNPLKIYESDLRPSLHKNHSDFVKNNLTRTLNTFEYATVPCGQCLNCRIDKQNQLVDRCEYEFINYGCGAFVTFTYDDAHNQKNAFIDCKDGQVKYSINKKDGKDFLNRLNKLVHAENKKTGYNPLCRKDYKYIITSEYGDKLNRNHFHCLFFGLDFAYCERLFWRAWQNQGAIQVGAIKNGGIGYVTKYISNQTFGIEKFYKYNYHHLTPPSSSHSIGLGEGLFKSQLKFIKEHDGCYQWHNKLRPLPSYYKNKYKIISDLQSDKYEKKYKAKCENIKNLYGIDIKNYRHLFNVSLDIANIRQKNTEIKMRQKGKPIYNPELIQKDLHDMRFNNHRLSGTFDNSLSRIINPDGTVLLKVNKSYKKTLTTRDLMRLKTDYKHLCRQYGSKITDSMFGLDPCPF